VKCPKCNAGPLILGNGDQVCATSAGITCPALNADEHVTLSVRVSVDLAASVRACAEREGITTAAWVRSTLESNTA
jgi:hypothetical protein